MSSNLLDEIKNTVDGFENRMYDLECVVRRFDDKLEDIDDCLELIAVRIGGIEAYMEASVDAFSNITRLDKYIENLEDNTKSLNRMFNELKGVISMTRTTLPKRCGSLNQEDVTSSS